MCIPRHKKVSKILMTFQQKFKKKVHMQMVIVRNTSHMNYSFHIQIVKDTSLVAF